MRKHTKKKDSCIFSTGKKRFINARKLFFCIFGEKKRIYFCN